MDQRREGATALLVRSVDRLRRSTGLPVALGGLVAHDGSAFTITELSGTLTRSLAGLEIATGDGLGGRALQLRRPALVGDYVAARGITHRYDDHVTPECLTALACVPVAPAGGPPLAMMYVGSRSESVLGDRALELVRPVADDLARDLAIDREIELRVRRREMASRRGDHAELRELRSALRSLIATTEDARTRDGLARLLGHDDTAEGVEPHAPCELTPRERDVLVRADEGMTNAEIGTDLELATQTVKGYMKSAMAKLDATNRVRAARTARRAGLLDPR